MFLLHKPAETVQPDRDAAEEENDARWRKTSKTQEPQPPGSLSGQPHLLVSQR
ncbi:F-box only protein 44 isoform X1 [Anopheles sinensis]|uniref:F-box only protein 44 isoform X1 n=1 Tax=Anopheles sinensis TaxID=74873 RepID=A0A084VEM5_ANOSI|nr:F-box only protein 44 isoform X1 [Anopheles sinensis]